VAQIRDYDDFWPFYLRAHRRPATRACHYAATTLGLIFLCASVRTARVEWAIAGLALGYGLAWFGHFFIERNKPATFGHPLWSFYSDFRMLALALSGRLSPHLEKALTSRGAAFPRPGTGTFSN